MGSELTLSVIGLGYVGLPLALALAKTYPVIGYDQNANRIAELRRGRDRTGEISPEYLAASEIIFTDDATGLRAADIFIVAVPTPVDASNQPELSALKLATECVGGVLRKGAIVAFESTVYPGVTEDICGPILERVSGLKCGSDFYIGYSPERINPGDSVHTVDRIVKVVAGQTQDVAETLASSFVPLGSVDEQWDVEGLDEELKKEFNLDLSIADFLKSDQAAGEKEIYQEVMNGLQAVHKKKVEKYSETVIHSLEKQVMLEVLDRHWKEHLARMDHLRQGIGLRGYAQKNPKHEYKRESFELFQGLLESIKYEVIQFLAIVELRDAQEVEQMQEKMEAASQVEMELKHDQHSALDSEPDPQSNNQDQTSQPFVREQAKVGRNEPCPCGAGKKFKQCHGKIS